MISAECFADFFRIFRDFFITLSLKRNPKKFSALPQEGRFNDVHQYQCGYHWIKVYDKNLKKHLRKKKSKVGFKNF
jgi:hypothetical protein